MAVTVAPGITVHGLNRGTIRWADDFKADEDEQGIITATQSFHCYLDEFFTVSPKKGSPCQEPGWEILLLKKLSVSNAKGGVGKVECTYGGVNENDFDFGDEDNPRTFSLGISVSEEPIETHVRYKDIPVKEKELIQNIKEGRYREAEGEANKYIKNGDSANGAKFALVDEMAIELAGKLKKGIDSYVVPNQIWRTSFISKTNVSAAKLNAVGKITTAPGAPTVSDDRDWLFIGASVDQVGDLFNITYEWRLSGPGGWDAEIYSIPAP